MWPNELELTEGKIVAINTTDDWMHIYVPGQIDIVCIVYEFSDEKIFKSNQEALDAMAKRLQDMK